jgi:hypothetical protein
VPGAAPRTGSPTIVGGDPHDSYKFVNNVTRGNVLAAAVSNQGEHVMPNDQDQPLSVSFRRNDGHRERIPLKDCTLAEATSAVERVFSVSEGLYTEAGIYRGNQLIEKMENHSPVRVESILIQ